MENYTGNVTVSKLSLGSPPSPRVKGFHRRGFFVFSQARIHGITMNNQPARVYVFVLPVCCAKTLQAF